MGDFNAHSSLWGCPRDDDRGNHLLNQMHRLHLISVNDPHCLPTFAATHIKGWPDVTLSSLSFFRTITSWSVEDDMHYGDHRLITTKLDTKIPKLPKRRYRRKEVSFTGFNHQFSSDLDKNNFNFEQINNQTTSMQHMENV